MRTLDWVDGLPLIVDQASNPAFDVTPADVVTTVGTDRRVIHLDEGTRP